MELQVRKDCFRYKMLLRLLRSIFVLVFATMFPETEKHGKIDREHVSATMFPEVDKYGNIDRKHNVSATSGEASSTFGHTNAYFSVFINRIRNLFLKKWIMIMI